MGGSDSKSTINSGLFVFATKIISGMDGDILYMKNTTENISCIFLARDIEIENIIADIYPGCRGVLLNYDLQGYKDELYTLYGIPRPLAWQDYGLARRAEYLAGRLAASLAIAEGAFGTGQVGMNKDRSPAWPSGLAGSISHTLGNACSLVAHADRYPLIGIDIETIMDVKTANEVHPVIASCREMAELESSGLSYQESLTLLFSAKETLYKALYPTTKTFMHFSDAELSHISSSAGCLMLTLRTSVCQGRYQGKVFHINYRRYKNAIFTFLCMTRGVPG
jgi:4'-phosphopantetheinyl transferase EntD